jgi:threonine dehydratase
VQALDADVAARGVVTHSSGNHGAALALAARERGIPAHVVVPDGANAVKLAAIEAYGATVHRCAATLAAREATAARVLADTGATLVHPYADPHVIAGQGTAALELLSESCPLDALVTPLGGGGLTAGTALVAAARGGAPVFGAEPAGAADAFESLRQGRHVTELVPDTLCDGLRATVGAPNLELMRTLGVQPLLASDAEVVAAMRLLWGRLKQAVEPSAAIALAVVLKHPGHFAGKRVGLILSGGNVDLDALPW